MSDTWAFGCLIWLYSWCSQISRDPIYVLWGVSHIHVECQRCLTYKSRGNPPIPLIQVDDFPPFCRGSKNWEKLPTTDPWDSKSLLYHKNIKHPCSYIYCSSHGYGFFRVNFQQPFLVWQHFPPPRPFVALRRPAAWRVGKAVAFKRRPFRVAGKSAGCRSTVGSQLCVSLGLGFHNGGFF